MQHFFFTPLDKKEYIKLLETFPATDHEEYPLDVAYNTYLSKDVLSPENLPLAARSCMDGYAVIAQNTFGATEHNPAYLEKIGEISIEKPYDAPLTMNNCLWIPTGGVLPHGANAVVMVEQTQNFVKEDGTETIEIYKASAPFENVMQVGEDAKEGSPVLFCSQKIRAQEIGLAAALGLRTLPVHKKVRVGIISTGDELIPYTEKPVIGQVRDVNSHALSILAKKAGAVVHSYGIVPDNHALLLSTVQTALKENDLILLSGGSSIGMRDLTIEVLEALENTKILAHGINISPGKPTILASSTVNGKETPIVGLPGQIASAHVVMLVLIMPFIEHLAGNTKAFSSPHAAFTARLTRNIPSKPGREDFCRVQLVENEDNTYSAVPVLGKSGLLRTLLLADGLVVIPSQSEGLYKDDSVQVIPLD